MNRDDSLDAPETTEPNAPVPWRLGKLTVVFVAIVLAGFAINSVLSEDDAGPAEADESFDVASFPVGAMGGKPAPIVSVDLFDGSRFDVQNHIATDGRPIVLNLWASWCFPCRTEMPEFSAVAEANEDVAFFGIAVRDNESDAAAFADEIGVAYPLGFDTDDTVNANYPSIGLPTTFLIDSDGTVVRQIQGQITGPALQAFIDHDFGG